MEGITTRLRSLATPVDMTPAAVAFDKSEFDAACDEIDALDRNLADENDRLFSEVRRLTAKVSGLPCEWPRASDGDLVKPGDLVTDGEYTFRVDEVVFHGDWSVSVCDDRSVGWAACDLEHVPDSFEQVVTDIVSDRNSYGCIEERLTAILPTMLTRLEAIARRGR